MNCDISGFRPQTQKVELPSLGYVQNDKQFHKKELPNSFDKESFGASPNLLISLKKNRVINITNFRIGNLHIVFNFYLTTIENIKIAQKYWTCDIKFINIYNQAVRIFKSLFLTALCPQNRSIIVSGA